MATFQSVVIDGISVSGGVVRVQIDQTMMSGSGAPFAIDGFVFATTAAPSGNRRRRLLMAAICAFLVGVFL